MLKPIRKIVVELDLTNLDHDIYELDWIKRIAIDYYNLGEGEVWSEYVPYKILKVIR